MPLLVDMPAVAAGAAGRMATGKLPANRSVVAIGGGRDLSLKGLSSGVFNSSGSTALAQERRSNRKNLATR
jgi:hypothetical protein